MGKIMEDRHTGPRTSTISGDREAIHGGWETSTALPSQAILRSELLSLLNAHIAIAHDEACVHLAHRLGANAAGPASAIDSDDPLFRGEVRSAAHDLVRDGLVELKPAPSCLQWRIVPRREAADCSGRIA
jgi:hypothetical protein